MVFAVLFVTAEEEVDGVVLFAPAAILGVVDGCGFAAATAVVDNSSSADLIAGNGSRHRGHRGIPVDSGDNILVVIVAAPPLGQH